MKEGEIDLLQTAGDKQQLFVFEMNESRCGSARVMELTHVKIYRATQNKITAWSNSFSHLKITTPNGKVCQGKSQMS